MLITQSMIRTTATEAAIAAGVPDVVAVEIDALLSGLLSSIGLHAVKLAFRDGACTELFSPTGNFEFASYPRTKMVLQLEACSGLPYTACDLVLRAIEDLIKPTRDDSVEIERIGEWVTHPDGGTRLKLDPQLAAVRIKHSPAT